MIQMDEIRNLMDDFVTENYEIAGLCQGCHDNGGSYPMPCSYKNSYEINLRELLAQIKALGI